MDKRPIGVFDSGVGGVTVLKEIQKFIPNENYIYIGDTASFPYGSKSQKTIIKLCKKRIEDLINNNVKLIVIACGTATSQALEEMQKIFTATSQALEEMQKIFNIPIIGIIEPTVKYLKDNNIRKIGIIATAGTIRSKGWEKKIKQNIKESDVQSKACPLLAPMAEEGWINNDIAKLAVHEYVKDIKNIEALILGCTHYPLFIDSIKKEVGKDVDIINTGKMVAREVKDYININNLQNNKSNKGITKIFLTDIECNFINVAKKLMQIEDISIKKLNN